MRGTASSWQQRTQQLRCELLAQPP
jgi:hypothetical protein